MYRSSDKNRLLYFKNQSINDVSCSTPYIDQLNRFENNRTIKTNELDTQKNIPSTQCCPCPPSPIPIASPAVQLLPGMPVPSEQIAISLPPGTVLPPWKPSIVLPSGHIAPPNQMTILIPSGNADITSNQTASILPSGSVVPPGQNVIVLPTGTIIPPGQIFTILATGSTVPPGQIALSTPPPIIPLDNDEPSSSEFINSMTTTPRDNFPIPSLLPPEQPSLAISSMNNFPSRKPSSSRFITLGDVIEKSFDSYPFINTF